MTHRVDCLTCLLLLIGTHASAATVTPTDLRCEFRTHPQGIDVARPHLGWRLVATDESATGQRQTAYHVRVANGGWDSGEVKSDASQDIEYAGPPLHVGQSCTWSVCVADENGHWSDWSKPATWSMGPLAASDWKANWIGSPTAAGRRPDPWLRKTFDLPEAPSHATIYVASIGYHELYVNGRKIGDGMFAPSTTDHAKRARYVAYDITDQLKAGRNVIGLWLGTSWSIFPAYQTPDKPAAPIALAQATIDMPTAGHRELITDGSWRAHDSPNTLLGSWDANNFGGEQYDARQESPGWCDADTDDSQWTPAAVFHPSLIVSADNTEPNILAKRIDPIAITEPTPGVYRIDMGINYAGLFEMPLTGDPGDRIELQFSERAEASMTFGLHSVYVLGPSGKGTFRNRFNYMAGRYVQITGLHSKPKLAVIKGWLVRPDYARVGGFSCDDPLLNRIYDAANWTFENCTLGNYLVDCPHRERRGYGDGFGATRLAFDNYRVDAFYTKWAQDWRDVQKPDGSVPNTAPTILGGGGPAWGGFCIALPWQTYCRYGDKRVLADGFPTMQRWLAFLDKGSKDNTLVRTGGRWGFLGDWQWPKFRDDRSKVEKSGQFLGDTRETLFFNNCVWIYNLQTAAKVADVLGDSTSAAAYRARADTVRAAVHATFFNPADASYVNGFEAYLGIALLVDLPPVALRSAVWHRLEQEILVHRNGHIWAGIIGGGFLFETLLDNHRDDLLYAMISKPDYPGWNDMLSDGGGTFHEDFDGRGTRLHDSFLYAGGWFIEGLGGIRQSDCAYKHIVIDPWIDPHAGPKHVDAHYDSAYGRIAVSWTKLPDRKVSLDVTVPPNCDAELKLQNVKPERAAIHLVAGHHHFKVDSQKESP